MAATGIVSGKDGGITFDGGYHVKCKNWKITYECDEVDTTALGDDWETVIGGIKRWSGSFDAMVNSVSLTTMTQLAVGATPSTGEFQFDATASTDGELTGTIMVKSADIGATVGGDTIVTFNFKGSGALSMTGAA